ncbi:ferric reductase-like transmembrane domain-containing protein [Chachezhania antarctica]|uniref:ferric reductase-like transmembrane domain-containing protein n=1 Tax=Chachezhania antarctica TaxID=2340860 RepID=UPI000EAD19D7|nr:ferric reductase-like transmembrane domain-containing protein [Chachezhania antarctica]|tara:strand:+ start:3687 stop:4304 length:618 start_codon:yes stop_codon:yes gene_type:complete
MPFGKGRGRAVLIWLAVLGLMIVPAALAAASPFLAYRDAPYIAGGFAGILALALLLPKPLMAAGWLPGLEGPRGRRWHRWVGALLVACVVVHVGGLFVASPPDTLDALLLVSPTPFSVYGVTAMWAVLLTALLVALRRRLGLRPVVWNVLHNALALVVVVATVVHAVQIQGAMEIVSKWVLCLAVIAVSVAVLFDLRIRKALRRR